jgi:uncharacterized membrane protein
MKKQDLKVAELVFTGVLAAMVYVVTLFRFPLLGSKVHFANAVCLLGGMLLGPWLGGAAAGLGSALFDAFNGYDALNVLITFVSKFAMAWVCGAIMHRSGKSRLRADRTVLSAVAGALTYVALYMLKTYIFGLIAGNGWAAVISKFPASIINAGAAVVAAPIFFHAVLPALKSSGALRYLRPTETGGKA